MRRRPLIWSSCAALLVAVVLVAPSVEAQVRKIATTILGPGGQLTVSSAAVTSTVPGLWPDGTAAAPAYSFAGAPTAGVYNFSGNLGIATIGTSRVAIGATSFLLRSDMAFGWSASDPQAVGADVSLSRQSAGTPVINSATATPAGGSTGLRLVFGTTAGFGIYVGSGLPTVSAAQGSIYLRSDGSSSSTRMYVNSNGTTAWVAVTTAS